MIYNYEQKMKIPILSSLGGEDFAFYLQKIEGCMVRFGARLSDKTGPAHSSTFDFDDGVLSIGAAWYAQVALQFCKSRGILQQKTKPFQL